MHCILFRIIFTCVCISILYLYLYLYFFQVSSAPAANLARWAADQVLPTVERLLYWPVKKMGLPNSDCSVIILYGHSSSASIPYNAVTFPIKYNCCSTWSNIHRWLLPTGGQTQKYPAVILATKGSTYHI